MPAFAEPSQAATLRAAGHTVTLSWDGSVAAGYGDVYAVIWNRGATQTGVTYVRSDQTTVWDALVTQLT